MFNKVIVSGKVVKIKEVNLSSGLILKVVLKNKRTFKSGENKKTVYTNVETVFYNKFAEAAIKKLQEGDYLIVEGKLAEERWKKGEETRKKVIISVDKFQKCNN